MAKINIRLNKNFQTQLNRMVEKYGEEFLQLQGLDEQKLSFTDFVNGFIDSDNVANASIDSNANISQSDIVTLLSEMAKPDQKLLAFNKLYYEINKKYGYKTANEAMEAMWSYALYMHDFNTCTFLPYCFSYDVSTIAEKGLFFIDNYNAKPAKHLDSFVQILMEAIAYLSRRQSGACGLANVIPYLYYFWSRDVKQGYYTQDPEIYKYQQIQAFIYRLNQPWVRSDQAAFTNISVFDHPYFEALFGGAIFPDGSFMIDEEEEIIEFQKDFIKVVNDIRKENVFTFPVLTASLLYQDGKFIDEDFAKWACEASREWNLFNFFVDESVNSLSNCPLDPSTKILYWSNHLKQFKLSTIKTVYKNRTRNGNNNPIIKVLSNGQEINCKINKFNIAPEYEITLVNGAKIKTTANHLNKVYGKDYVPTSDLTVDDYLPYGRHSYEKSDNLTYEEGYIVGAYLGDGSRNGKNSIVFSLNADTDRDFMDWLHDYIPKHFDGYCNEDVLTSSLSGEQKCINFRMTSPYLCGLINQYVLGDSALNKEISLKALSCSKKFRQGIIDGWYKTDGGNNNRIYTSSLKLVESMNAIFASLGMVTRINKDNRENRLGSNACYTVRYYTPGSRKKFKDTYIIDDDYMWIKIKSITRCATRSAETSYCLEVLDDVEPIFMLGNGVITHNCRLKGELDNAYFNSIGGTALEVGSVKVSTINLARLAYQAKNEQDFLVKLRDITELNLKILDTQRGIIKRNAEKGLLPNIERGLMNLDSMYSTVGINGVFETIKTFGYTEKDDFGNCSYTRKAYDLGQKIFKVIQNCIDNFALDKNYKINIEQAPAEQAAVKMQQADKLLYPEKVVLDLPLYGNQWIPLGIKATIAERTKICAAFDKFCNGGSIEHINLDAPFANFDQAWHMLNWVAEQGVTYFAFNGKVSQCADHHSFYGATCPECGKPADVEYTRVVGFYTPTKSYSKERKQEFNLREWMPLNEKGECA